MSDALVITDSIAIPLDDIEMRAIRSRGAGGQNVNKVATAIHLRFDARRCEALPEAARERLLSRDDHRITADGVVVIKAQEHRTQERNRRAALERLRELLQAVIVEEKPRKPTSVPEAVRRQRVEDKRRRGDLKRSRSRIDGED